MKKSITTIIAAGAIAGGAMFQPAPASAAVAPLVIAIPVVFLTLATINAVSKAQAAQQAPRGTITVKPVRKHKRR